MRQIDYGSAPPEVVSEVERMRQTLSPERRLLIAKFLGMSVLIDGDDAEMLVGTMIDRAVTALFQEKYPEQEA